MHRVRLDDKSEARTVKAWVLSIVNARCHGRPNSAGFMEMESNDLY